MNEFIAWDRKEESFKYSGKDKYYEFTPFQGLCKYYTDEVEDRFTFHKHIGIKDINEKKIYADCSIIEFDFTGFGETESERYKGFIKWNNERYRYDIEVFSHGDKDGDNYIFNLGKCINRIETLKIIGTLQEDGEKFGFSCKQ